MAIGELLNLELCSPNQNTNYYSDEEKEEITWKQCLQLTDCKKTTKCCNLRHLMTNRIVTCMAAENSFH
ncbi:hypothetical protein BAE44_0006590 [Dichanthelium oligosanthes]|uniref:Uncharacterized protein n=1 Tax=Dichanthelium oligosanthes TaxID=888268 RepID=A0A1E5W550_9POAL|nr:hypothetical protein BAE44_0006590 [Dichanthelium oligosanthes]